MFISDSIPIITNFHRQILMPNVILIRVFVYQNNRAMTKTELNVKEARCISYSKLIMNI